MKGKRGADAHPLEHKAKLTPRGPAIDRRKEPRQRLTVNVPQSVVARLRAAVFFTAGATLAGMVMDAITAHIDALERQRGAPFPPHDEPLRPGRPTVK